MVLLLGSDEKDVIRIEGPNGARLQISGNAEILSLKILNGNKPKVSIFYSKGENPKIEYWDDSDEHSFKQASEIEIGKPNK